MSTESERIKAIHAGYHANVFAERGEWLKAAQAHANAEDLCIRLAARAGKVGLEEQAHRLAKQTERLLREGGEC